MVTRSFQCRLFIPKQYSQVQPLERCAEYQESWCSWARGNRGNSHREGGIRILLKGGEHEKGGKAWGGWREDKLAQEYSGTLEGQNVTSAFSFQPHSV